MMITKDRNELPCVKSETEVQGVQLTDIHDCTNNSKRVHISSTFDFQRAQEYWWEVANAIQLGNCVL